MRPYLARAFLPSLSRSPILRRTNATLANLTSPTKEDAAHFAKFLPSSSVITTFNSHATNNGDELDQYNLDWMGKYRGKSRIVLRPKTTEDVSKIMKHCWERRIGVVPQGGNTGLVVRHKLGKALAEDEIGDAPAFVLVETSGGNKEHDEAKLQEFLEEVMSDESLVKTGVLAQATEQFQQLWSLRECIPEAVSKEGKAYKYDISVPVTAFEDVVKKTRTQLESHGLYKTPGGVKEVVGYGHIGDGNLHLNVIAEKYSQEVENALEPFVYELVASFKGSISAEHGIGLMKAHALHYSKSKESIDLMRKIKHLFDERGIMNPGKIIE
ncbi:hypothetical protein FRC19_001016 [Serendipita sp. 401]|nr:hypothetical protein FRC19_001016 [Serendipita sp. 401]